MKKLDNIDHDFRKLGLGGSDIAIIMGLSSYKTPYDLFLEKTGVIEPTFEDTALQEWGKRLEAPIADKFAETHGVELIQHEPIIHPKHDFLRGNIDRYIKDYKCPLEIKTANSFMSDYWGEDGSDYIPMPYLVQVAHYVSLLGADCGYIAVLIGGNDYREYKYNRNAELEKNIFDCAAQFWHGVQNKIPPAAVNISDLKKMYDKPEEKKVIMPEKEIYILEEYKELKAAIKEAERREKEIKFKFMEIMKEATLLEDASGKKVATWKADVKGVRRFLTTK